MHFVPPNRRDDFVRNEHRCSIHCCGSIDCIQYPECGRSSFSVKPTICNVDVTDSSLEVTDFHLDKNANVNHEDMRAVLTAIDTLGTSSTTTVEKATNIYEVYKSTHLSDSEIESLLYFEKWILKLFNDSDNTRSRVCLCLVQNAGLSEEESYMKMMHAHRNGEAIIGEYCQEHDY